MSGGNPNIAILNLMTDIDSTRLDLIKELNRVNQEAAEAQVFSLRNSRQIRSF